MGFCVALSLYVFLSQDISQTAYPKYEEDEAEALLTIEHGDAAVAGVNHFEQTWFSLEMHKDPKPYLYELLTGPLLNYYVNQVHYQEDGDWLIPGQTDVLDLKVVDFNDQRMKVIACLNQGIIRVNRSGTVIERYPLRRIAKLYVLILDEGSWKVGNFIDITDPEQALQDWDFMSKDLKKIIGEIRSFVYNSCKETHQD